MKRSLTLGLAFILSSPVACGGHVDTSSFDTTDAGTGGDTSAPSDSYAGGETGFPFYDVGPGPDAPFPDSPAPIDSSVDGGVDGATDTGPVIVPPSVCDKYAATICEAAATKACCDSQSVPYDKTGCTDSLTSYCRYQSDRVRTGKMTYDGSKLDECLAGWSKAMMACSLSWITFEKIYSPCSALFNGTTAAGSACKDDTDCKAPDGASASCDRTSKKCRVYDIVGKGAGCNYAGAVIHYCDLGLHCDVTSTTPTCATDSAIGAACDGPDDASCGWGNVCKSNKCAVGLAPGATCTLNTECASWYCNAGKCSDSNTTLAVPFICSGAAGP